MEQVLPFDTLKALSAGTENHFIFDFSTIPEICYEPFFKSLQKNTKLISHLGFSCDELAKYPNIKNKELLPPKVFQSIACKKIHYIRNMIELLYFVLPRSPLLKSLTFSNFVINENADRFYVSLGKSQTLESLSISHVPINNDGLKAILDNLNPSKIQNILIDNCQITNSIVPDILNFISKRKDSAHGIQSFVIKDISFEQQKVIDDALVGDDSQIADDFSNDEFSAIEVAEPNEEKNETKSQILLLKQQNRVLREQIKAIKEMANSIQINDSLFVVGSGSANLISHLTSIEQKLIEIDQNQF